MEQFFTMQYQGAQMQVHYEWSDPETGAEKLECCFPNNPNPPLLDSFDMAFIKEEANEHLCEVLVASNNDRQDYINDLYRKEHN